ncbi:MAG: hypothetical protein M3Y56_04170, partial [Armatimonadota bacterium]|nr:hypothetical protein [Armatimonadota bacterium]
MTPRIARDFLAADITSIDRVIAQMTDDDFATKMTLESRRADLTAELENSRVSGHTMASAALFFSGKPVVGSYGIESEFGAGVIATFQDIVSKVSATRQSRTLGQRGPISGKPQSKLHITHIVHGSFGFQFEELDDPLLFDSGLKESVDETVKLMASFDEPDDDVFGEAVEDIDNRVVETMLKFFDLVHTSEATFRVVSDDIDKNYDRLA